MLCINVSKGEYRWCIKEWRWFILVIEMEGIGEELDQDLVWMPIVPSDCSFNCL